MVVHYDGAVMKRPNYVQQLLFLKDREEFNKGFKNLHKMIYKKKAERPKG